jgi:TolB-like protein/Tfp pilus assembly protein PilF
MPSEQTSDVKFEIGHVLFIDIVGYSKLNIHEQSEQLETLKQIVRGTEQFKKAEREGKLLRLPTGDGGALVFRTTPEAPVLCAVEVAKALKAHPELNVRMGIHSGPVNEITDLNEQANIAGAGINLAQRVMDCGDAGHILLSKHVADDLEEFGQWRPLLHELGPCEVKHGVRVDITHLYSDEVGNSALPRKFQALKKHRAHVRWAGVAIALLVVAAVIGEFFYLLRRGPARSFTNVGEKSIAVFPFENLSRDPDNAYFAEGIQDEILTRLSKIADLKVISRTSTQHYKSAPANLPEIAQQLGVAHILEGSVQKSGDAVRVNVQLIKAANDSHLWADTFDRKLTDIFSVESEVAKAIAEQLRAHLTGQEEQVIAAKPTGNVEAYDAYLRGLAYTLKTTNTPANALSAQKYLREAVRLDPKFAHSWALLAFVDAVGYNAQTLQPTVALREEARQAAETALALQPNLGEALHAMGYYHYILKDYEAAVHYFEQARQLLPNNSQISGSLAYVARRQGQWERSETYFNEAERLDPRNVYLLGQHAGSYEALRRFPEALLKFDQVLKIMPNDVDTLVQKAAIAQAEGDLPRAAALLDPLHPAADDPAALEIQAYQAILERRPAQIIPRLDEALHNVDPALGYYNSELRFYLSWAQEVAGDHAAAQENWRQVGGELELLLKDQPENFVLLGVLALTKMELNDKPSALAFAERAVRANPAEKDALYGPLPLEIRARVLAGSGNVDGAIAILEKLLSIPYLGALLGQVPLTPALLRLDPMFDPLRNDPRFQRLCEDKPK